MATKREQAQDQADIRIRLKARLRRGMTGAKADALIKRPQYMAERACGCVDCDCTACEERAADMHTEPNRDYCAHGLIELILEDE